MMGFAIQLVCRAVQCLSVVVLLVVSSNATAQWSVTSRGSMVLDTSSVANVNGMSGITYMGSSGNGQHQFAAVQDNGGQLVSFDVEFATNGSVNSAVANEGLSLSPSFDFEGLAYTSPYRNSVFVSEESTPTVREFDLATGNQLQSLAVPTVFSNTRGNRGFESLTLSYDGKSMWTANEEALTIDGPASSLSASTVVRLQRMDVISNSVMATEQFAYMVAPIHTGTQTNSRTRSGLVDLVALPDGSLLTLERSLAITGSFFGQEIYGYENRIYQVDTSSATDLNVSMFDTGLQGESFTPASKTLLWSGQTGMAPLGAGENMEGLTFGPRLANGNWSLLGVVDNGGSTDPLSSNTVVAFELTPPLSTGTQGDYNFDGTVDQNDYTLWRSTFGLTHRLAADGNHDGSVDAADYTIWRDALPSPGASQSLSVSVPEPATAVLVVLFAFSLLLSTVRCSIRKQLATEDTE